MGWWLLAVAAVAAAVAATAATFNPVADTKATVTVQGQSFQARFTVLTPQLLRCEVVPVGDTFRDAATLAVVNRLLPVPRFTSSYSSDKTTLRIETDYLLVQYVLGSDARPFNESNLNITVKALSTTWKPGDKPTGNLLGTIRTLDKVRGPTNLDCNSMTKNELADSHCTMGLISRDGWTLVDDSSNAVLDNSSWPWIVKQAANSATCSLANDEKIDCNPKDFGGKAKCEELGCCYSASSSELRTPSCFYPRTLETEATAVQDWYFFGHGHDYLQALYEFTLISGQHPLPPRYTYGSQYSKWVVHAHARAQT
eukprot:TRINITY_DN3416_c0_g1_i1.p1 TRINITY_DN3416_c0_g1~~TRINITY_DN3416_c0_g1_i1.p1  ORF type:complete len:312 (-),score=69.80 TRINITY_DN3416_c0_g1_i1:23-958(-)